MTTATSNAIGPIVAAEVEDLVSLSIEYNNGKYLINGSNGKKVIWSWDGTNRTNAIAELELALERLQ